MRTRAFLLPVVIWGLVFGESEQALGSAAGNLHAGGSFVCDFVIPGAIPGDQVAPLIERDRMFMAERPGMINKYLPLAIDTDTGNFLSGGRYLFDTFVHSLRYERWVKTEFALDGVLFFDRPIFIAPDCHAYAVFGAHDFNPDPAAHLAVRIERWTTQGAPRLIDLLLVWLAARREASQRGLVGVWLTFRPDLRRAQLIYYGGSPGELAGAPSLLAHPPRRWTKSFDRTSFVWTVWFPFEPGDQGQAALWPNSPPLPDPFCGDGVCEVSRGEDHASCIVECGPSCGDAVCDSDENNFLCPGDCRNF